MLSPRRNATGSEPSGTNVPSTTTATTVPPVPGSSQIRAESEEDVKKKSKEEEGWRRVVRNFIPSWFAVTMGTGIVSILLHNIPYNADWMYYMSVVIFCLNICLFVIFFIISLLRYTLYPEIWFVMLRHPSQSLFVGTFPMGFATIINMVVFVCVPAWGDDWAYVAWVLWMIDVIVAVGCCFYVPFDIMYLHTTNLQTMLATWLLPIVSTIVASASGAIVAGVLPNAQHALWTVIASYVLWGTGVPLAMVVLVIYFQRLTLHKLPAKEAIVSVFLPLGLLGQGGFAIQELGLIAMNLFPHTNTLPLVAPIHSTTITPITSAAINAGQILYVLGWLIATIMWGFGLVWLFFAAASITRGRFPFNMGWWGFTFPLGVFATSTLQMGKELPSAFFRVLGTVFGALVVLLWAVVAVMTVVELYRGGLISAPCLKDLDEKKAMEQLAVSGANV